MLDDEKRMKGQKEKDKEQANDRLDKDYQLARAIDLILGINIYQQTLLEK